jgi:hypothetical protein
MIASMPDISPHPSPTRGTATGNMQAGEHMLNRKFGIQWTNTTTRQGLTKQPPNWKFNVGNLEEVSMFYKKNLDLFAILGYADK